MPERRILSITCLLIGIWACGMGLNGCSSEGERFRERRSGGLDGTVKSGGAPHTDLSAADKSSREQIPSGVVPTPPSGNQASVRETDGVPGSRLVGPRKSGTAITQGSGEGASNSVETLHGYKTPAEYLTIPFQNYPDAIVAVMLPEDYYDQPGKKYPLVIAFGGAGECARPPRQGSLAWIRYYKTDEAARALHGGKLGESDFRGLVSEKQLGDFNLRLKKHPYQGVILACPWSPPLPIHSRLEIPEYESFVMQELIPRLTRRYRTLPDAVGVDGVSMGGARAVYYGFKYPETFTSIGSVQGAFGPYMEIYEDLVRKNRKSLSHRPIQLVTSDGDVMLRSNERLHGFLRTERIAHRYLVLTGPHDYIFNQGPGALALLLFHHHVMTQARAEVPTR